MGIQNFLVFAVEEENGGGGVQEYLNTWALFKAIDMGGPGRCGRNPSFLCGISHGATKGDVLIKIRRGLGIIYSF
jgi:hypothetical protein